MNEEDGQSWVVLDDGIDSKVGSDVCFLCRNYWRYDDKPRRCNAFPDGIPDEIWLAKNRHTEPYDGDHGVLYERVTDDELAEIGRRAHQGLLEMGVIEEDLNDLHRRIASRARP